MRIHTSLTQAEIYACLPKGVDAYVTRHNSRKRENAYEVTLYVYEKDALHRRFGNSGGYGRSSDVAATWDDWGIWMDRLYDKDPDIIIPGYESYAGFMSETRRYRDNVHTFNKPESLAVRTHKAPWLS